MADHRICEINERDLKRALERSRRLAQRIVINPSLFDKTTIAEALDVMKAIDRELFPETANAQ